MPESVRPVLVLLPGMDGTGTLFADFAAALPPTIEPLVVAYPVDVPLGYAELTALVRSRLPADRPFVLLGESFSGPVAVALAAESPPGLRGLVLCATFLRSPVPGPRSLLRLAAAVSPPRFPLPLARRVALGRFGSPETGRVFDAAVARLPGPVVSARIRAIVDVDARAVAAAVTVPVLCIRGTHDVAVPGRAQREIEKSIPACRTVRLRGPHLILQTASADAARVVADFVLRGTAAVPSSKG